MSDDLTRKLDEYRPLLLTVAKPIYIHACEASWMRLTSCRRPCYTPAKAWMGFEASAKPKESLGCGLFSPAFSMTPCEVFCGRNAILIGKGTSRRQPNSHPSACKR